MLIDPPADEVVEVSIFGPGKGESIAVHLGYGEWIIVDSCDTPTGDVPVLSYLRGIGVDLAKSVRLVVATHAHDDHFGGISRVLDSCESAHFVIPTAGSTEEYWAQIELDRELPSFVRRSAVEEYRRAFQIVRQRRRDANGNRYLKYAHQCRELLALRQDGPLPATVTALSPSDESLSRSRERLISQFPSKGDRKRRRSLDPNDMAIALWIQVGDVAALLGADVLKGPAGCGWRSIESAFRPNQRASLIKVPHHGSPNAHLHATWTGLLTEEPTALVAPYDRGVTPRPARADARRICELTRDSFVTAARRTPLSAEARAEAGRLGPLAKNVRMPSTRVGQIRARCRQGSGRWSVEFTSPARRLAEIAK